MEFRSYQIMKFEVSFPMILKRQDGGKMDERLCTQDHRWKTEDGNKPNQLTLRLSLNDTESWYGFRILETYVCVLENTQNSK